MDLVPLRNHPVSPGALVFVLGLFFSGISALAEPHQRYLSDLVAEGGIVHDQQWGRLGLDTAMVEGSDTPKIRIGRRTYQRGLGHHATGGILVDLNGQYEAFCAEVGVQWQGGGRGSVVFRVEVDGREVFLCWEEGEDEIGFWHDLDAGYGGRRPL